MTLLSRPPRVDLIKIIAEGATPAETIAQRIEVPVHEIAEHLLVLHENGVIQLEDDRYSLSPRVKIRRTNTQHIIEFNVAGADTSMTLVLNRIIDS